MEVEKNKFALAVSLVKTNTYIKGIENLIEQLYEELEVAKKNKKALENLIKK